jgi:hypothetical protein
MDILLTKKQKEAIARFYQRVDAARADFAPETRRSLDYHAWSVYYEAKEDAKYTLSIRIPGLSKVSDFWSHVYNHALAEAIERSWAFENEKKNTKQTELELESEDDKETKKIVRKIKKKARRKTKRLARKLPIVA